MIHVLDKLLDIAQVLHIRSVLNGLPDEAWRDGKETAGELIKDRKQNEQLVDLPDELRDRIAGALLSNSRFERVALPKALITPTISRYREGDRYDVHIDNAVTGATRQRQDVIVIVALNDASEYEGGELVIVTGDVNTSFRLNAGDAVVFAAHLFHRVKPIVSGLRLSANMHVTSRVKDPVQREILYRMSQAMDSMLNDAPKEGMLDPMAFVSQNLRRMWLDD